MAITLYPAGCSDFSTNGLGALTPLTCVVSEEAGGMFELELKHPIDDTLRWAQLAPGCIVKAPIPTRESPLYEEVEDVWGEAPVTVTRNVWVVSGTTVGLYMRSGPGTRYKKYGYLKNGAKVNEIGRQTVNGRVWVHVIVQKGGRNCWMSTKWLKRSGTVTETLSQGKVIGQRTVRCEQSRDQLFRIHSVERDAGERIVTVKAMHIFYDLRGNLVNRAYEAKKVEAKDALTTAFGALAAPTDFELHVAAGVSGRVDGDYGWKNPVECMLDPDEGILPQARATLVRDNFDVFVLPDFTRDSGVTIRRGKNLKGVRVTEDASDIVTRIIPCGKNKKGEDLFLSGTNYVDSPRIGDYPVPYVKKIDYDAKTVDKDADNETTFKNDAATRAKLRALAEADFTENGVDLPGYGMDVDFVLLQNIGEDAEYAGLQAVFLNDTVTVIDSLIGLTAKLRVTGYKWDALRRQYESVTLGDVRSLEQTTYSYNLPQGGVSGSKLAAGSVPGAALRNATIEYAKIAVAAIEQLTADSVTALTARIQEIVSQQITTDELYAALATLNQAVIEHAEIRWADIESLQAAVAAIASVKIGTADIDWAQIKDLISGTAIITQGEAGQLFISRLAVTEANMVSLTTGELVVKGEDGCFYSVTVDAEGNIRAELKQVSNDDVADLSLNAGEKLIEGSVTAACLNATDIFADNAVIRKMIAANLDVDELFAREAFIALLRTSHIVGENSLEIVVHNTEAAQQAANAALKRVDVEYYLSDSPTELSGGTWSTTAPEWVDGKYMWSRTAAYPNEGEPTYSEPTCIAGATGATGTDGASLRVLMTAYRASQEELEAWSAPGHNGGAWAVESTEGVRVGDTVLFRCYNTTKQGSVYIIATVTSIDSATAMHATSAGLLDKGATGETGEAGQTGAGFHVLVTAYRASQEELEAWSAPGYNGGAWTVDSTDGVRVGDTVALQCYNTTKRGYVYIYGTVTEVTSATALRMTSAGMTDKGESVSEIAEEYYLSTSNTEQTGGSWSKDQPEWVEGCYLWTRSRITWTDGNTSTTEPVLAGAINSANNVKVGGRNLLIDATITKDKYIDESGAEKDYRSYAASDYIAVMPGERLVYQLWVTDGVAVDIWSAWISVTYYNSDKGYIGGYDSIATGDAIYNIRRLTVPEGAAYIRCSYRWNDDKNIVKLERGTKATDWSPAPEDVNQQISDVEEIANDNSGRMDGFERLVRVEEDGLHVGDNQTQNEAVLDSDGLGVRVAGEEYSRFGRTYARFGNYELGLHLEEGGLVIRPA